MEFWVQKSESEIKLRPFIPIRKLGKYFQLDQVSNTWRGVWNLSYLVHLIELVLPYLWTTHGNRRRRSMKSCLQYRASRLHFPGWTMKVHNNFLERVGLTHQPVFRLVLGVAKSFFCGEVDSFGAGQTRSNCSMISSSRCRSPELNLLHTWLIRWPWRMPLSFSLPHKP